MNTIVEKINTLKKEKNAVILAHCYQNVEIDEVADFVGDSLYLSRKARDTNADIIVFAGVSFMAETAKLLSPEKKVLLPRLESGCFMANMINVESLRQFKAMHPGIPTVCYVNSTADIKAECDVCCTSSNAVDVVRNIGTDEVLFLPDTYLGKWVEAQLGGRVKVHTYNGFCPTHLRLRAEDMEKSRLEHPNSKILAHPECHHTVSALADFVGSTKEIMEYVHKTNFKEYTIELISKLNCIKDNNEYLFNKDLGFSFIWNSLNRKAKKEIIAKLISSLEISRDDKYNIEVDLYIIKNFYYM